MPKALPKRFTDEAAARQHLEGLLWPDGPTCPHCGVINEASRIAGGRKGLLFCNACRKQFSVTVGTVYERSKLPLNTWLYANHLLCASKKGISSQQLARMLGVTVKTAWFMSHRIRETWVPASGAGPLGGEGQIVEADETELSPSRKSRPRARKDLEEHQQIRSSRLLAWVMCLSRQQSRPWRGSFPITGLQPKPPGSSVFGRCRLAFSGPSPRGRRIFRRSACSTMPPQMNWRTPLPNA